MKTPFLIGSTVYLRAIEREDAALAQAWINDPEVNFFMRTNWPLNRQAEEQFIDKIAQSEHDLVLMMVRREGDLPLGLTGFHQIDYFRRHAMFGITIGAKEEWGKGYGTEATRLMVAHAFATLNLNRVWLHVYEYNARAQRTYEKVGFKKEGVLRQDHYRQGRYWDTIAMGILRAEWKE